MPHMHGSHVLVINPRLCGFVTLSSAFCPQTLLLRGYICNCKTHLLPKHGISQQKVAFSLAPAEQCSVLVLINLCIDMNSKYTQTQTHIQRTPTLHSICGASFLCEVNQKLRPQPPCLCINCPVLEEKSLMCCLDTKPGHTSESNCCSDFTWDKPIWTARSTTTNLYSGTWIHLNTAMPSVCVSCQCERDLGMSWDST